MEIFIPRLEIRRQVFTLAGFSADLLLSSQEKSRVDMLIDMAALRVAAQQRWLSLRRDATTFIDPDQTIVSYRQLEQAYWMKQVYPGSYHPGTFKTPADTWYPADLATAPIHDVAGDGVTDVVYWDDYKKQYRPMVRAVEPARFSQDRWADATAEAKLQGIFKGEPSSQVTKDIDAAEGQRKAQRARPYSYDLRADGIHVWPIPDLRYVLRVTYTITPTWTSPQQGPDPVTLDQRPSVVDGMAIIYYSVSEVFAQMADDYQAKRFQALGDERVKQIRARQATGEAVVADTESAFDNDYEQLDRQLPRWNLGPFVRT